MQIICLINSISFSLKESHTAESFRYTLSHSTSQWLLFQALFHLYLIVKIRHNKCYATFSLKIQHLIAEQDNYELFGRMKRKITKFETGNYNLV